jgi:MFS family permease
MNREQVQNPLRNPCFRYLWIGNTISSCGDQFFLVALPWLILQFSNSAVVLGEIMMIEAIPRGVLMLVGGAVTDRRSPRAILVATAVARAVLVAALAVAVWTHQLQSWQLYGLAFTFGVADAFAAPAGQALLPWVVRPEQLPIANSLSQISGQLTALIVPAPAGMVVASLGIAWAFSIDAVSFLFVIAALWMLRIPASAAAAGQQPNIGRSILDGLQYVGNDATLRSLLLVAAALNFCITGPMSVGAAFLAKSLFDSPTAYGLLMTSAAAGSLAGALAAGFRQSRKRGRLLLAVSTIIGVCTASIGLFHNLWSLMLVLFVMSASAGLLNVQLLALLQQRVDRNFLGRVISLVLFAGTGLMPISLGAAGLAVAWSLPGMFAGAGTVLILVTVVAAAHRSVRDID